MSNEVKIALLAIVAIGLSYWGYRFIRGKNILASSNIYYVQYDDVDQLNISAPVLINGYQVGFVSDVFLKPDNYDIVVVTLDLRKDIRIPRDTRAIITDVSFMGGKAVILDFAAPCSGDDCAPSGAYLDGARVGLVENMLGPDQIDSYLSTLKAGLADVADTLSYTLFSAEAEGPLSETVIRLNATLSNLQTTTDRMNAILAANSGDINALMKNLRALSETLENNTAAIDSIIANVYTVSEGLAEADVQKIVRELDVAVGRLNATLASADTAVTGVAQVVGQLQEGQGTLGKLLYDEALYLQLTEASIQTDSLLEDLQERPYRYIPFKSRRKVKRFDRQDAQAAERIDRETAGSN